MASHSKRTILVAGATGHQGGAVFKHLYGKFPLRVLARNPDDPKIRTLERPGVELAHGDLDDLASLKRAMDDVYGVYSMQTSSDTSAEIRQGKNVIDAARAESVSHLVYSSVASADRNTGIPHFESKFQIEEHLRASGVKNTIVRPVFFMDNWPNWKDQILAGRLELPLSPETRLQMLDVDDIGAFVARAFEHSGKWIGRTFEMAGDERSMAELVKEFGRILDREVKYAQLPWDEFAKRIDPDHLKMFRWFEDEGFHIDIAAVRQELPMLHTFEEWLQTTWRSQIEAEMAAQKR